MNLGLQKHPFETLLAKLEKALRTFEGLSSNYQGTDVDEIFGEAYKNSIKSTQELILALKEKVAAYDLALARITSEQNLRKIPTNVRQLYTQAKQVLTTQQPIIIALKERIFTYPNLDLGYETWKTEVETSSNTLNKSIQDLKLALDSLVNAVALFEKENGNTSEYKRWKTGRFKSLLETYEEIQYDANKLLQHEALTGKIALLSRNDGYLELLDNKSENNFTEEEKKLFLKNIPANYKLRHEVPLDEEGEELELFEEGAHVDDIEQGQVADCYLLAAMANLANENTAHLLEEMIEEREENGQKIYTVTLYQEGVPIKVEVDGKLMTLTAPESENLRNPKKNLTAVPQKDIWVPIIEKAYVKLMAQGNYQSIEEGRPQDAMKILLGNKVQTPNSLVLNSEGELLAKGEGTRIPNPIPLASTSLQQLQQILTDAHKKGYKMNLNSPDTYKGVKDLDHNHVFNLGAGNYMSFNHVYTITAINGNTVSVFNPHGKSISAKTFFDKDLYGLMQSLDNLKQQLEKEYKNKGFSDDSMNAMADVLKQLNTSTFKSNFVRIINLLESIAQEGVKQKGSIWIFTKKSYDKQFIKLTELIAKLLDDDFGKGFVKTSNKIEIKQNISLKTIKEYFEYIVISIIK